ncbi:unnamed protein product [Peronospora belbahrii]|nr:unnamed protein product [Peronospora belbahrii]
MDSSLLLWNKKRQPRATAVLASFVSLNKVDRPPSDADKELFFVACELAETQYAFSDVGVGATADDVMGYGEFNSLYCGQPAQFYLRNYKTRVGNVSAAQVQRVLARQRFYDISVEWEHNAITIENELEQTQADDLANTKLEFVMEQLSNGAPFDEYYAKTGTMAGATDPAFTPTSLKSLVTEETKERAEYMDEATKRAEIERKLETRLIHSLSTLSQQTTSMQRGIVLPL